MDRPAHNHEVLAARLFLRRLQAAAAVQRKLAIPQPISAMTDAVEELLVFTPLDAVRALLRSGDAPQRNRPHRSPGILHEGLSSRGSTPNEATVPWSDATHRTKVSPRAERESAVRSPGRSVPHPMAAAQLSAAPRDLLNANPDLQHTGPGKAVSSALPPLPDSLPGGTTERLSLAERRSRLRAELERVMGAADVVGRAAASTIRPAVQAQAGNRPAEPLRLGSALVALAEQLTTSRVYRAATQPPDFASSASPSDELLPRRQLSTDRTLPMHSLRTTPSTSAARMDAPTGGTNPPYLPEKFEDPTALRPVRLEPRELSVDEWFEGLYRHGVDLS